MSLAVHGDTIWLADGWTNAFVRTNLEGELLDWGESPFGNHCLAYDGEHVWALDQENKRVCALEKAAGPGLEPCSGG